MENNKEIISEYELILRNALEDIEDLNSMVDAYTQPIAIIGMGCRFPGASNTPEAFWNLLSGGMDGITDIPADRFDIDSYYDPEPGKPEKIITRKGAFIKDIDLFDADFFNISPIEAEAMDPQQRLLLHVTWEALERAAIAPDSLRETATGVYIGVSNNDYGFLLNERQESISSHTASGNALNALSGRLSYCLKLQGPSMIIDTACSSSLVSIHIACKSLQNGDCNLAIAGGTNIIIAPGNYIALSSGQMLSPEGHCKTFDESADGYARGEGVGVIILKRLSDAKNDRDTILAVIKGSAVNQDGPSNGLTVPNGNAQMRLMRQALKQANLTPTDISYVEAHGTGTSLGDPIEVNAIGGVYGESREQGAPLLIGSIKSNIGHLESAAGISSLTKVILALNHKAIPGNLHFHKLNPKIDLESIPAKIITELTPWNVKEGQKRLAGISGFGFTGTNAHIILEEAPSLETMESKREERPLHLFTLSARSKEALNELVKSYQVFLKTTEEHLSDIVYTASTGRNHDSFRISLVVKDTKDLISKLDAGLYLEGKVDRDKRYKIVFHYIESGGHTIHEIKNNVIDIDIGPSTNWEQLLNQLSDYYIAGANIDWKEFESPFNRKKVLLPTYPFKPQRYWAEGAMPSIGKRMESVHPLLGEMHRKPNGEIDFNGQLYLSALPYLKDHQVYGYTIYPGAGYMEMLLAAGLNGIGEGVIQVSNISIEAALSFQSNKPIDTQILMSPIELGYDVAIYTEAADSSWICHAKGNVSVKDFTQEPPRGDIEALKSRCGIILKKGEFYARVNAGGIYYGDHFQALNTLYLGKQEALGELKIISSAKGYLSHPAILDGCLQLLAGSLWQEENKSLYLPVGCEALELYSPLGEHLFAHWTEKESTDSGKSGDLVLYNSSGKVLATLTGMHYRKTTEHALKQMLAHESSVDDFLYDWVWEEHNLGEVVIPEVLGHWLVLSDGKATDSVVDLFKAKGGTCKRVSLEDHPKTKEAYVEILQKEPLSGIIHLSSTGESKALSMESINKAQTLGTESVLHLCQALVELQGTLQIPVFLITSTHLANSPLNGLYKTIIGEHPGLEIKHILLNGKWESDLLFKSLFLKDGEPIISIRENKSYVPRLLRDRDAKIRRHELTRPADALRICSPLFQEVF